MESEISPKPIKETSFEELVSLLNQAKQTADFQTIVQIANEARDRDGWDDTDPTYYHLGLDCQEALKDVMTYYG